MEIYVYIIMVRKSSDFVDAWIQRTNWKVGNFNTLPIIFGVTMALIDIVMMSTLKMTSQGKILTSIGLPIAMAMYALQPVVFLKGISYEGMVVMNLVWNLMSNILVTLQGILVFGESIKGLRWLGIAMSLVALTILAYTNE